MAVGRGRFVLGLVVGVVVASAVVVGDCGRSAASRPDAHGQAEAARDGEGVRIGRVAAAARRGAEADRRRRARRLRLRRARLRRDPEKTRSSATRRATSSMTCRRTTSEGRRRPRPRTRACGGRRRSSRRTASSRSRTASGRCAASTSDGDLRRRGRGLIIPTRSPAPRSRRPRSISSPSTWARSRKIRGDPPHSHMDHYGRVAGIVSREDVAAGKVRIIAPQGFLEHAVSENIIAGPAMGRRAVFQFGVHAAARFGGRDDPASARASRRARCRCSRRPT